MEFKKIQKLIKDIHGVELHAIHSSSDLKKIAPHTDLDSEKTHLITRFYEKHQYDLDPLFVETNDDSNFIMFPTADFYYLLGPFTIDSKQTSLPYLKKAALRSLAELLYYLIFEKQGAKLLFSGDLETAPQPSLPHSSLTPDIPLHQQELESMMLTAIREGQIDKVKELLLLNPINKENDSIGVLSKKSLMRHYRNISITTVTLATRAAIQGGLFPEIAYTLSDRYIQALEDTQFISDISKLMTDALVELTRKVHQEKQLNFSPITNKAREYISNHLYDPITREDVADFLTISPNHLDKIFKGDLKTSAARYIKHEKLNLACELIEQQQYSLSEISESLGFHSLNSFSKLFKNYFGYTPSQHLRHLSH